MLMHLDFPLVRSNRSGQSTELFCYHSKEGDGNDHQHAKGNDWLHYVRVSRCSMFKSDFDCTDEDRYENEYGDRGTESEESNNPSHALFLYKRDRLRHHSVNSSYNEYPNETTSRATMRCGDETTIE